MRKKRKLLALQHLLFFFAWDVIPLVSKSRFPSPARNSNLAPFSRAQSKSNKQIQKHHHQVVCFNISANCKNTREADNRQPFQDEPATPAAPAST